MNIIKKKDFLDFDLLIFKLINDFVNLTQFLSTAKKFKEIKKNINYLKLDSLYSH